MTAFYLRTICMLFYILIILYGSVFKYCCTVLTFREFCFPAGSNLATNPVQTELHL